MERTSANSSGGNSSSTGSRESGSKAVDVVTETKETASSGGNNSGSTLWKNSSEVTKEGGSSGENNTQLKRNQFQTSGCIDISKIPLSGEHVYATNNQFLKAGPKGFVGVKVLENNKLYVRVDLPGVPEGAFRYSFDAVKKMVEFSGKTPEQDGVREYSGTAGLGCECCEITGVEAMVKVGVLRMTISKVKVKEQEKQCTLTLPLSTDLEDHPFLVKGRKGACVGVPTAEGGLYFAVDVPGVDADNINVSVHQNQVGFCALAKKCEHDESDRIYLGIIDTPFHEALLSDDTITWDSEFGVLKLLIEVPPQETNKA